MKPLRSVGVAGAFLLLLAVAAQAQTVIVTNIFKREVWPGWTRAQVTTNINPTTGNNIIAATNFSWPTAWDVEDNAQNYASRNSGLIIPTNSGLYDFYLACDDDSDLYLGTNSSPTSKYLIAQEDGWSPRLSWLTNGGPESISISSQKNSATWTNASGVAPYASGISLVAGTPYYFEVIQAQQTGNGTMGVTMVPHGTVLFGGEPTTLTAAGSGIALIAVQIPKPLVLVVSQSPTNTTVYPGMTAYLRTAVTHNSLLPPTFQWQRGTVVGGMTNYVDIPNATNGTVLTGGSSSSIYSFVGSTNDTDARFRCIATVPTLTRTSGAAVLTVPASGGLTVSGRLKRELFTGLTTTGAVNTIIAGNNNYPASVNAFPSFELPTAGNNYGERVNGFFTPTATASYVFFLTANDNALLFFSTNDQPSGKALVAQEDGWSDPGDWNGFTSANGSIYTQKRSDFWSPDGGATTPWSAGFPLVSGQRYYIEAVHWGGPPDNHVGVTFATVAEVAGGQPMNNDPTRLTNGVISYVTTPVTTFMITNQPSNVTRDEGLPYTFVVGVQTDSEVAPNYQWKKNGMNILGATARTYTSIALIGDNGATFSCDISLPGVTNVTSSGATLSVIQGVFAGGILKREFWTNASARGITRQLVGANVGGTFPDADYTLYTQSLDISENRGEDYIQRVSGFFVPPATTEYVFFLATDDDGDMYLSTDEQPANKYLIAQETSWSDARQWTTSNGGDPAQKRSDQFNGGIYAAGIHLVAGERYYLEVVHHENTGGDAVTATFIYLGEPDPINFTTPSRFGGENIGVPVPPATTLNIDTHPQSVAAYGWQPAYVSVAASTDGLAPPVYQWRRNSGGGFTNIPGAISSNYGFITSSNDNGAQFQCIVSAPGVPSLTQTSTVATLTIQSGTTFEAGSLDQEWWNTGVSTSLIEGGGLGPADTLSTVTNLQFGQLGTSFANRIRGFFIPPVTTNYCFFICSDNNSDLFLSTDDQPANKRLIAQEEGFSEALNWNLSTSGNASQKSSCTWSPDGGFTMPYSSGIPLVAGQHYYIEIVHSETGGADNLAVTYKMVDEPNPIDITDSIITSAVLGRMAAPVVVPQPVLTATKSGSTLTVSWTPAGGTLESTSSLIPPINWIPVGTINPTNLTIGPGNRFLRVSVP